MRKMLREELEEAGEGLPPIMLFPEHHLSHAASAFFPSPFTDAAILTVDGVGEWATTTLGHGVESDITIQKELHFPHSVGLLYSAFTAYCGFKVNSGEYKLMGLAPYGYKGSKRVARYGELIHEYLADLRPDGSLLLNMDFFNYATGLTMCRNDRWQEIFDLPAREPETEISQEYMDLALAIQEFTEEAVLRLARTAKELTKSDNLCMAGGVALNCVATGKLIQEKLFERIWVQPAAGDAGGALGAAYAAHCIWAGRPRPVCCGADLMQGAYLGPAFSDGEIKRGVRRYNPVYKRYDDFSELCGDIADLLADGNVVGWFQGRMEFGPRALGNRSILGDPRNPEMQKKLNLKIKYREGFRPFAPSVAEEKLGDWFDMDQPTPYMLVVAPVADEKRLSLPDNYDAMPMWDRLYVQRSVVPAITHVDFSARIQSVNSDVNKRYHQLISTFEERHGCPIVVNTSFNVRGEPIVCTPRDAYRCFMRTEMDVLVLGDFVFFKRDQQPLPEEERDIDQFEMD